MAGRLLLLMTIPMGTGTLRPSGLKVCQETILHLGERVR